MIHSRTITTYAQYNEDIILLALLHDVKEGFYVDVGANYPTVDSVTKLFYERGWHGINIEPIKELYQQLVKSRKRDVNLHLGVGDKGGTLVLREYIDIPGHSTFADKQKDEHKEEVRHRDYKVEIKTLKEIFADQRVNHINFLKIDVEGFEYEVVKGNDWKQYRPEIICIESNHVSHDWRQILTKNRYRLFIADGLNEYYVAEEAWHRTEGFVERVVEADYYTLKQHQFEAWTADSKRLEVLTRLEQNYSKHIQELTQRNQELLKRARLSLSDRSLFERIKRSFYGLTVDWVRYVRTRRGTKT